jgi:LPXTG-motif cell wall-anchored protein
MSRTRLLAALLGLTLAAPSAAFAQGAGDDQYQDPFGDEQAQTQTDGGEGGLSQTPPDTGGGGDAGTPAPAPSTGAPSAALPNTGSDARLLALLGASMLMVGVGLRLRTIDPNAY